MCSIGVQVCYMTLTELYSTVVGQQRGGQRTCSR